MEKIDKPKSGSALTENNGEEKSEKSEEKMDDLMLMSEVCEIVSDDSTENIVEVAEEQQFLGFRSIFDI